MHANYFKFNLSANYFHIEKFPKLTKAILSNGTTTIVEVLIQNVSNYLNPNMQKCIYQKLIVPYIGYFSKVSLYFGFIRPYWLCVHNEFFMDQLDISQLSYSLLNVNFVQIVELY